MQVKLISKTTNENNDSLERIVVYTARVSNPSNQNNGKTDDKLIRYLIKNKHWSPFEMVDVCFEIETSIAMAMQLLRHKSQSPQMFSQRYQNVNELDTFFQPVEIRLANASNRQSSTVITNEFDNEIETLLEVILNLYNRMIERGVAPETARNILPMCTTTKLYLKGSLRSVLHYLDVRLNDHTQKEHRLVAVEIAKILIDLCPNIAKTTSNFNDLQGNFTEKMIIENYLKGLENV